MFTGRDPSSFSDGLVASSLTNWLNQLSSGKSFHVFLYPIVIVGLILVLWLIYLVCRFLIFRPIAKSKFASKSLGLTQIMESRVLGSMASIVAIVVIDIGIDWLPDIDKEFVGMAHRVISSVFILIVAHMIVRIARLADTYYSSLPSVTKQTRKTN